MATTHSDEADIGTPLLRTNSESTYSTFSEQTQPPDREHSKICRLIYVSHFLSTWNTRTFEFGAFMFLANTWKTTLLPASVYALARAASAAVLSPFLGSYIDRADRLQAVRISIVGQRVAVIISCVAFYSITRFTILREHEMASTISLVILSVLACVEKLCSVLNTVSVERDWVPAISGDTEEQLRSLSSQMRRIDLFCKLVGPLAIAMVDSVSSEIAMIVTAGMTVLSFPVECTAIARVYGAVPALKLPKSQSTTDLAQENLCTRLRNVFSGTRIYSQHPAVLPSISLALLYLTVLSFASQMVTYLVALGVSSGVIGILRGVSALFELSTTWLAPRVMSKIGPVRTGLVFLNWEILCVMAACAFLWLEISPTISVIGTVSAVVASRVGLWGFDLSAQIIVQGIAHPAPSIVSTLECLLEVLEEVEAEHRGTFSSQEFALQNVFELLAFASTIIFSRPMQFKYPATISAGALVLAGVLYATFVRSRRGHLVHLSNCINRNGRHKGHHHWWMIIANRTRAEEGGNDPQRS